MKNITVSVDEETYRKARIRAAERDTSVSRMVREFLNQIAGQESEFERLARQERELRAQLKNFSGADRLSREELHARSLGRQKR
jgi:plasmid stability protein